MILPLLACLLVLMLLLSGCDQPQQSSDDSAGLFITLECSRPCPGLQSVVDIHNKKLLTSATAEVTK